MCTTWKKSRIVHCVGFIPDGAFDVRFARVWCRTDFQSHDFEGLGPTQPRAAEAARRRRMHCAAAPKRTAAGTRHKVGGLPEACRACLVVTRASPFGEDSSHSLIALARAPGIYGDGTHRLESAGVNRKPIENPCLAPSG